jgi:hypothetical protein
MNKQVRFGSGPNDKARLPTITEQQIEEIAAITGENKNAVVQSAITRYYMEIVYNAQAKKLEQLQAEYDKVYSALVSKD